MTPDYATKMARFTTGTLTYVCTFVTKFQDRPYVKKGPEF